MLSRLLLLWALTLASAVAAQQLPPPPEITPPPAVAGEFVVKLKPEFDGCLHCILKERRSLKRATGARLFSELLHKYRIRAADPLFAGTHDHHAKSRSAGDEELDHLYRIRVDPGFDPKKVMADLRRERLVQWVEPNYLYSTDGAEPAPDPFLSSSGSWGQDFANLWGLHRMRVPQAWEVTRGEGTVIAVVDTGLAIDHPDIAANVWRNPGEIAANGIDDDGNGYADDVHGWDFTTCTYFRPGTRRCLEEKERGADLTDEAGHGTHVAGIAAAIGDNGIGISGVAPAAKVMAVKALNADGQAALSDLADAVVYAADNGADVINASWSGAPSETVAAAIDYAVRVKDVVVTASSGNNGAPLERGLYPAGIVDVVTVGSLAQSGERASHSNYGGGLDLMAPGGGLPVGATEGDGVSILSLSAPGSRMARRCREEFDCDDDGNCVVREECEDSVYLVGQQYIRASGTSMAVAYVSGVAGLVRSRYPEATGAQVRGILTEAAQSGEPRDWDELTGYGALDALEAVNRAPGPVARILAPGNREKRWPGNPPFEVIGTTATPGAAFKRWELKLRRIGGGSASTIASGGTPVIDGPLATLELDTQLEAGHRYSLELSSEDADGRIARDQKTFIVPAATFVGIPFPGGQLGFDGAMSADGTVIVGPISDDSWAFDAKSWRLRRFPQARSIRIAPSGTDIFYFDRHTFVASGYLGPLFAAELVPVQFPRDFNEESLALSEGSTLTFMSVSDPLARNQDRSLEVFRFHLPSGPFEQLSNVQSEPQTAYHRTLDVTPDGNRFVVQASYDFDPTATADGSPQIFLYDTTNARFRQLTNDPRVGDDVTGASISADGQLVAFQRHREITLLDVKSGNERTVATGSGAQMASDGRHLTFFSNRDLDPTSANTELDWELFVLDLSTGDHAQISDFQLAVDAGNASPSADATTIVASAGFKVASSGVYPGPLRFVRRSINNMPPVLSAPYEIEVSEGREVTVRMLAFDPKGKAVVFYLSTVEPIPSLRSFGDYEFIDSLRGNALFRLKPNFHSAGEYPLRLAVFNAEGGVTATDVTLRIRDAMPSGDANCDGVLSAGDLTTLSQSLFDASAASCETGDTNQDGRRSAADLIGLVGALEE